MDEPILPLASIVANETLELRAARASDPQEEIRALADIRRALTGSPRALLQQLAETTLQLCRAQSAGISLLEEAGGRRQFRWYAVAGEFRELLWTTLPRESSPCGEVLDRGTPLLMIAPERHYPIIRLVRPQVFEVLLVPFAVRGKLVGTVWAVSHTEARQFDREDRRLLGVLTAFAAAAYERLESMGPQDVIDLARMRSGTLVPDDPKRDPKRDPR